MNIFDILYTPLDLPEMPKIDLPKLRVWISEYKDKQEIDNRGDFSKVLPNDGYPWDIIYARTKQGWYNNFDKEFPEFAEYSIQGFGLDPSDIHDIILLPIKRTFTGLGFYHSDLDEYGLRFYLENNETENFLYVKPTTKPYVTREQLLAGQKFQDIEHAAKLLKPNQAFFINNVRAVHAVNSTELSPTRIAVIVSVLKPLAQHKLKDLIINSAKKFPEHTILWTPPAK
jgi:hypothetical protein